jgi:predicted dehydrogenase
MQINRRNFLRIAGTAGVGMMLPGKLTGSETYSEKNLSASKTLKNIYKETYKKHPQRFNMCGYAAPKLDTVRVGFVGMGNRGNGAIQRISRIDGVEITGICDVLPGAAQKAKERIKTPGHSPAIYSGDEDSWMEMFRRDDLDLIYITTPWKLHAPMAVYAMEHGKHVAVEIPAAITVEDCWKLVETSERTKKHCVILENCCYDFFELLTLNLARNGFFGDIIHTEGAYIHDIGKSLFFRGKPGRSWRLKENMMRNGCLYPTHGLGPVAQVMNINRGNKMEYLVSMSTNDFHMNNHAKELSKKEDYFKQFIDAPFRGNMNTSTIKTVKGQTIMLQHDVTTPRPYSRIHLISGTEATAQKYPLPGRISLAKDYKNWLPEEKFIELEKEYTPPIVNKIGELAKQIGGHGGMDFLMDWRLIDCLRNGLPVDMDVYDAAAWSVIGPLSEWSVANRSMPIDIPDFTNGLWKTNQPHDILLEKGGNTGVRA